MLLVNLLSYSLQYFFLKWKNTPQIVSIHFL